MPIAAQCWCGRKFSLADDAAGTRVRCAYCKEVFNVPGVSASAPPPPLTDAQLQTALLRVIASRLGWLLLLAVLPLILGVVGLVLWLTLAAAIGAAPK